MNRILKLFIFACLLMGIGYYMPASGELSVDWIMRNHTNINHLEYVCSTAATTKRTIAIISDLHDVALDRTSGDMARFTKLSPFARLQFLARVSWYGIHHGLSLIGFTNRPALEPLVLKGQTDPEIKEFILDLISPFAFNPFMAQFFKQFAHKDSSKVFGFSNIGPHSLAFMQERYPDEFAHFAEIQTNYHEAEGCHLLKNNPRAHEVMIQRLREHYNGSLPTVIFYLDDKPGNLDLFKKVLQVQPDGKTVQFLPYCFASPEQFENDCELVGLTVDAFNHE